MRLAWIGLAAVPLALSLSACGPSNSSGVCGEAECLGYYDSGSGFDGQPSRTPMLVRVQSGKTLKAGAGDGVGVFVLYASGGHWTIWWTCDTDQSPSHTCAYDIQAKTLGGDISNVAGVDGTTLTPDTEGGAGAEGGVAEAGAPVPAIQITTQVTNLIQGVTFDTPPGAILEVEASLDGLYDGSLFYFVDGDKVKDGYKGQLSDPLEFQPTSP
jgi:hypothetical protein